MDAVDRFALLISDGKNGCIEWAGAKNSKTGYGIFCLDGKKILAHRAAMILFGSGIPSGLHVCHKCDNPGCVNVDHLFVGNAMDNYMDSYAKGRRNFQRKKSLEALAKEEAEITIADQERKSKGIILLTYIEAADRIRVSKRTLQAMVARGVFGKTRISRESCVFSDEIDAYIDGLARGNGEAAVRAYRMRQGRIKR